MTDEELHYVDFQCCQIWPIALGYPVRRCGLCGQIPIWAGAKEVQAKPKVSAPSERGSSEVHHCPKCGSFSVEPHHHELMSDHPEWNELGGSHG